MIVLHRLNGKEFAVNPDMIKFLESAPDTIVTLDVHAAKDEKFMVKESVQEVIGLIRDFRIECQQWQEPKGKG